MKVNVIGSISSKEQIDEIQLVAKIFIVSDRIRYLTSQKYKDEQIETITKQFVSEHKEELE